MRLLCFDPGHSTGVAVLDKEGNWEMGLTVSSAALTDRFFRYISAIAKADIVLVEKPPMLANDHITMKNYTLITHYFTVAGYQVERINPGQWKGIGKRVTIAGTHASDAATMGSWYHRSRLVNILE